MTDLLSRLLGTQMRGRIKSFLGHNWPWIIPVLTFLWFLLSTDFRGYEICVKFSCVEFFYQEFSFLVAILSAEVAVAGAIIAFKRLSIARQTLTNNVELRSYQLMVDFLDVEEKRAELNNTTINRPILFTCIKSYFENSHHGENALNQLAKLVNEGNKVSLLSFNRRNHLRKTENAFRKMGIALPQVEETQQFSIEQTCIELINSLLNILGGYFSNKSQSLGIPVPEYIPPGS